MTGREENSNQSRLTPKDLGRLLVDQGVPRHGIDRKSTQFLLDLCKQKTSRLSEEKSNLNHKNRVTVLQSFPRIGPMYRPRTPQMKGRQHPLKEKPLIHC